MTVSRLSIGFIAALLIAFPCIAQIKIPGLSEALASPDTPALRLAEFAARLRVAEDLPQDQRLLVADALSGEWASEYVAATSWSAPADDQSQAVAVRAADLGVALSKFAESRAAAELHLDRRAEAALDGSWIEEWRRMRRDDRRRRWLSAIQAAIVLDRDLKTLPGTIESFMASMSGVDRADPLFQQAERALDEAIVRCATDWPRAAAASLTAAANAEHISADEWVTKQAAEATAIKKPLRAAWTALGSWESRVTGDDRERFQSALQAQLCPALERSRIADRVMESELDAHQGTELARRLQETRSIWTTERTQIERRYMERVKVFVDRALWPERQSQERRSFADVVRRESEELRAFERRCVRAILSLLVANEVKPGLAARAAFAWAD